MKYSIYLNRDYIGYTLFEGADPPMGVVIGKIVFEISESPYIFIRDYCVSRGVIFNEDDPEIEALFTQSIPGLRVLNENDVEIKGAGATICGFKDEGYQIDVFGIAYPFYGEEFPHHRDAYDNQFK